MRVLVTMFPWTSHYLAIVPFGWACRLAGHEVRVATMPTMMPAVLESGLTAVPIGPAGGPAEAFERAGIDPRHKPPRPRRAAGEDGGRDDAAQDTLSPWPQDWPAHPERLSDAQRQAVSRIGLFASVIGDSQVEDLAAVIRDWQPDVLVHDSTQFAAPVAAALTGTPTARYLLGTPGMLRVDTAYSAEPVPEYAELFTKRGLVPRIEPDVWIDPCPPSVQYPYPPDADVLAMRFVPYNGTATVPGWLHAAPARPRVCVTWGFTEAELSGTRMLGLLRQTLDALSGLDVEPVLVINPKLRELLGEQPDGVRTVLSTPLGLVLATCAAVVHHGGAGTAMTASALGVPQLAITTPPHYALPGFRVAGTGAGRHLRVDEISDGAAGVTEIREHVSALLTDPGHRAAAIRLREEIAALPSPATVVESLARRVAPGDHRSEGALSCAS
ncbi:nucleotide disphospho-sugar-binding domain-containing protein [Streptomyces sp. NPDC047813]|uniref:nucleotide disphospho-sugar-binding domain-containing protein n=1 Tax=Streptomyces sp. NPDC047813 TaxID=3154608 RepID=UPI003411549C